MRAIVGGLALAGFLLASPPAMAQVDYEVGVGLYQKKRWEDAAASFARFIKKHPENPQVESALLYSGFALTNAADYAAAQKVFLEFVVDYPESERLGDALYRLGEASYMLKDYQQAARAFSQFVTGNPEHDLRKWALPYLGDSELRLKQYANAERHFQAAIKQFPKGPLVADAKFGLARALELQGKQAAAVAAYSQIAAGTSSQAAAAQMRLATIQFDAGEFDQAADAFRALVERFPKSKFVETAQLNAGYSSYHAGDYAAAIATLNRAIERGADEPAAYHWLGMAYKALGTNRKAAQAFKTLIKKYPGSELVGESRFQWADMALRGGQPKRALQLYETIAKAKPPGEHTAASVYFAAEAAFMLEDIEQAEELIARFERDFGQTPYRMHVRLLAGQVLEQQAALKTTSKAESATLQEQALAKYQSVIDDTQVKQTAATARYQAGRLRKQRGEFEQSLKVLDPLLKGSDDGDSRARLPKALILAAQDYLALEQFNKSLEAAESYLKAAPDGRLTAEALTARATAHLALKQPSAAMADWKKLKALTKATPKETLTAARKLAEQAYDAEQWETAADFFKDVVALAGNGPQGALGLSGLGWALHEAGENREAARAFGQLLQQYPRADRLAAEAAYMKGKSLEDAGDLAAAGAAYKAAFEQFAPKEPAQPEAEAAGIARNVYLAGLQRARVLRRQGKRQAADAAYAALVKVFPHPANLDKLLDEWALLHYEAGDYKKADALFQRIVAETPNSPRAASARLSLAESAMVGGNLKDSLKMAKQVATGKIATEATQARARSLLVTLPAEMGEWKQTLAAAKTYLSDYPDGNERAVVRYLKGEALLHTGQFQEAKQALTKVMDQAEKVGGRDWYPRVKLVMAEIAFQTKDYEDAEKWLEEFAAIEPAPDYAYTADEIQGRISKQQAQFDEARQAYQRVLDNKSARGTETAARAQYGMAETYFLQHQWKDARIEALRVYTLYHSPQWQAPALLMVGLTDEMMGHPQKAVKTFSGVVAEFPNSTAAKKAREKLEELRGPAKTGK